MTTDNVSGLEMDPDMARKLFNEGAFLIIAGVPPNTQFGIDLCSYTVGENFRGVKMIAPGPHFVWCASQGGESPDTAPRVGFVHYFHSKEILVREWDKENEELRKRDIPEAQVEIERIRENICELDSYLAPYDYRFHARWRNLMDVVTEENLLKCAPELGVIRTNMEFESCPDAERPRGRLADDIRKQSLMVADEDDLLPHLKPVPGTAIRFTPLPSRIPSDAKPEDVSRHSMDCVEAIDTWRSHFSADNELIAEIQLSFVFFLCGHSMESLAHWRNTLKLLAHSEESVEKYRLLYMKYSELMAYQLPYLPEELMVPSERNTVFKDVKSLLLNLNVGGLAHHASRLMQKLAKELLWNFEGLLEEDPDDLPVVVECPA